MSETKITVILVDDHDVVRQGVKTYLNLQVDIEVVAEAENGETAVALVEQFAPDVVLMDLIMPGDMDGVEATRQIKQISPRSKIIILTSYHQDEHIFPAIRAGAFSYILKSVKAAELVDVIRKAVHNEAVLHPRVAARVVQELHGSRLDEVNPYTELTDREMEVLQLVAQGLNNQEIADKMFVTPKTVRSHTSNILAKLHLQDRTQAAVYAWQQGIVRRDA